MRQDLRYALRGMRRHKGLSAVVVLTVALAVGASTAIFSLADGLLFRALPVREPQNLLLLKWRAQRFPRVVGIYIRYGACGGAESEIGSCTFSPAFLKMLQTRSHTLAGVAGFAENGDDSLVARGRALTATDELVSGNFFQLLGLKPLLGRLPAPSDDHSGAPAVMVLSYAYWKNHLGGDRSIIGSTVELNRNPVTVIGVVQPGFPGLTPGAEVNAWMPLAMERQINPYWTRGYDAPGSHWVVLVGRARAGVTTAAVQAEVSGMFHNLMLAGPNPLAKPGDKLRVLVLHAQTALAGARTQLREPLELLLWLVGAVLLIACANLAGLLIGRAQAREKEMEVRRALGAGWGRILQQLLIESLLLAVCGGALGVGLAWAGNRALLALAFSGLPFYRLSAPMGAAVLEFALAATVGTGVLAGVAPALRGGKPMVRVERRRRLSLGKGLVVAQVAMCLVVLAGAGLLARTLVNLRGIDPGFDPGNLLLFTIDPSSAGYQGQGMLDVIQRVQRDLKTLPGVESVSYSQFPLLSRSYMNGAARISPGGGYVRFKEMGVGPDFFATMDMRLLRGRGFRDTDFVPEPLPNAPPAKNPPPRAAVVNQMFVQKFLGPGNPIGRQIGYGKHGEHPTFTLIGVVSNAKFDNLRASLQPIMYTPDSYYAAFVVRTVSAPTAMLPAARRVVHGIDANLPLIRPSTEAQTIDQLLFRERALARLSGLFGVLALLLAAIGLYALLAQEVTLRTREIGIRMALGAERRQVLRLVVGLGLGLAAGGIGLGLAGALAATRYLHSLLYGVGASDPLTLTGVGVILLGVAFAACWLPARRATRVDPMVALRYE
ncbi:MAG: ABC transporter permease [Terriglobales bacterium]